MSTQRIKTSLDVVVTVHLSENFPGQAILSIRIDDEHNKRYAEVFLNEMDRETLVKMLNGEEI